MGSPFEIMFQFARLSSDVTNQAEDWQLLLRINAEFLIILNDKTFYREVDFPVVEFALHASHWLKSHERDFNYTSIEAEEDPLISFRTATCGSLAPYSPHQLITARNITRNSLELAFQTFVDEVCSEVLREFEIDIDRIL